MNDQSKINNEFINESNEEIDIGFLLKILIRNKFTILVFILITTSLSVINSLNKKPIFSGSFQIIVRNKRETNLKNSNLELINLVAGQTLNDNKTEELILKSPLVLKPVFNFAKEEYLKRNNKLKNLSYKKWEKNKLIIKFTKGTQILNIAFKDQDKKFILDTLNLIKNKYQSYSKQERQQNLKNLNLYLEEQQAELKKQSLASLLELNKFSIKNGLGDIDGFVSLGKNKITNNQTFINLQKLAGDSSSFNSSTSENAGQRFQNQFSLLEKYEATYADLSSRLKPASNYLKDLKLKIDNLRTSLERPNEILIKYKELVKISERDENLLNKIENELIATKLEIKKQQDPWQLISDPTIDDIKVSPNTITSAIQALIFSFFIGLFFVIWRERKSGIIHELSFLKKSINCKYLETIFINNIELSIKLFHKIIQRDLETANQNIKSKISIVDLTNQFNLIDRVLKDLNKFGYYEFIKINDENSFKGTNKLVFILTTSKITTKDIITINKYMNIYRENTLGWFYLDNKTFL